MKHRSKNISITRLGGLLLAAALALGACTQFGAPKYADLAAAITPGPPATATAAVKTGSVKAVDLIAAWVEAGAPETEAFTFTGVDGNQYSASFETAVLPLLTVDNFWFEGSQACSACHFGNIAGSYHEMDLLTYEGILKGGDVLSAPPGTPILGQSEVGQSDYDWAHARLRDRLRNNRMPPEWPFDITEANRDGPCVTVSKSGAQVQKDDGGKLMFGCELTATGLIGAWLDAGAPEEATFVYGENDLSFERDVLPFFTQANIWFDGSQACASCHFANSAASAHEMDLSSYQGMMHGGDSVSNPPGVAILGESAIGESDYDWTLSKLRDRLRNNRMAPGAPFDITESNRDGPVIQVETSQ